jgi:hypothetical protein
MKIELTKQEAEKYFYNALCNGLGYFESYGIELKYDEKEYKKATKTAKAEDGGRVCYEDVFMEMLKNGNTLFAEDSNADETYALTLDKIYTKMYEVPANTLMEMINERDDADTADIILQVCFIGEHTYG